MANSSGGDREASELEAVAEVEFARLLVVDEKITRALREHAALVDEVSLSLLTGSEIDFADELAAAEFRIKNPNAKTSCGCGTSFSL